MKKHTLALLLLIIPLLLSACGGAKITPAETPVAIQEIQTGADKMMAEPTIEPADANQPSAEVEETMAIAETPRVEQAAPTYTPYPTLNSRAELSHSY
jgi:hypothetical protein